MFKPNEIVLSASGQLIDYIVSIISDHYEIIVFKEGNDWHPLKSKLKINSLKDSVLYTDIFVV